MTNELRHPSENMNYKVDLSYIIISIFFIPVIFSKVFHNLGQSKQKCKSGESNDKFAGAVDHTQSDKEGLMEWHGKTI